MDRATEIEERLAHLTRAIEDLSEVVARQEGEIARLERRVAMLLEREADRESGSAHVFADQRPPHW